MNVLTLPFDNALETQTFGLKSKQAPNLFKMNCLCILSNTYLFKKKNQQKTPGTTERIDCLC